MSFLLHLLFNWISTISIPILILAGAAYLFLFTNLKLQWVVLIALAAPAYLFNGITYNSGISRERAVWVAKQQAEHARQVEAAQNAAKEYAAEAASREAADKAAEQKENDYEAEIAKEHGNSVDSKRDVERLRDLWR